MVRVKALVDVVLADEPGPIRMQAGQEYEMKSSKMAAMGASVGYVQIIGAEGAETAESPTAESVETATAPAQRKGRTRRKKAD